MLHKLRDRAQDEKGFTLIELLVVILIIGILAAIALPAFLNQRGKAQDSEAKSAVRTAQTAMETYYTEEQDYAGADEATLRGIEGALGEGQAGLTLDVVSATDTGYSISVESKTENVFFITKTIDVGAGTSSVARTCTDQGSYGCPDDTGW
jgi:type IV pilus assembly protein PilA